MAVRKNADEVPARELYEVCDMIDFNNYDIVTFDCYGTLIDWESGILTALKQLFVNHNISLDDEQILKLFAEFESEQEKGEYTKYRDILKTVVRKFGERLNFEPSLSEQDALPNSIRTWQPFPDTIEALKTLKKRLKLAIISNIDDDLFASTAQQLDIEFDQVITAEQAKSYKPSLNNFKLAINKIGLPSKKILHAASSIYHDIVPASSLGLSTVWVNRRSNKKGSGAALSASGQADLEVPDLQSLAALSSQQS